MRHFPELYEQAIGQVLSRSPGPDKFAHTYAGLLIWLLTAILLRRRLGSALPLVVTIVAELINERIDRAAHGTWAWPDTLGDMAATWFWPIILTVALRFRRLRG